MHEERWQALVVDSLARTLGLDPCYLHREVPTRDGSRADVVHARGGRITIFELKHADHGEAACSLSPRAVRQLRHYRAAADAVYVVTISAARGWTMVHDGQVVATEPLERQLLPDGVGWIGFDRHGLLSTVLVPAPPLTPKLEDRVFLVEQIEARLKRAMREAKRCRA